MSSYPYNWIAEMTKKPCQNNPQFMYTGKESSPRGLGWCAENMAIGERMKGRDGTMWMVAIKNSLNVWTRVPSELEEPGAAATAAAEPAAAETAAAAAAAAAAAPSTSAASTPAKKKAAPKKKAAAAAPAPETELVPEKIAEAAAEPPMPKKPAQTEIVPADDEEPAEKKAAPKKKAAAEPASPAAAKSPAPKKPPTDFALYIKMKVRELKAENPAGKPNDNLGAAAKAWKALSEDEKVAEIARARAAADAAAA